MGHGDNLMATGMARGARARGKRIAFGDGRRIIFDQNSESIFRGNLNIAWPGSERDKDIEWVHFYRGSRIYNHQSGEHWSWNYDFRAKPGEIFFSPDERMRAHDGGERGFVLIEPNVPEFKSCAPNKRWPVARWQETADKLRRDGCRVVQLVHTGSSHILSGVHRVHTSTFKLGLAALSRAALYVGPEGGLHHGAAALGVPAVVLFGGFIPPQVTGYDTHVNLTGDSQEACGSLRPCAHCRRAMESIGVDEVTVSARAILDVGAAARA